MCVSTCMSLCICMYSEGRRTVRNNNIILSKTMSGKLVEKTIFIEAFCYMNFLQLSIILPNIRVHT